MKKVTFFCFSILLASCSLNEEERAMSASENTQLSDELESVVADYELTLKGYSFDELNKEKDELTPTTQEETCAEPELIKAIQDSLNKLILAYDSKTRTDTRAYGGNAPKVGVFKYGTCSGNREFVYRMDCEDGGDTHATGNVGSTTVDGNVRFRFCLVDPGNYGGGTLILYDYVWNINEGDVDLVKRYHDNEDHKNKNSLEDNGGLVSTGLSNFGHNTTLYWRFSDKPAQKLGFQHGVLRKASSTPIPNAINSIYIDDQYADLEDAKPFIEEWQQVVQGRMTASEISFAKQSKEIRAQEFAELKENGKNGNEAILWTYRAIKNGPTGPLVPQISSRNLNGETFRGITTGNNTTYYIDIMNL